MTLRFAHGCVVASYRGRYCAAMTWDALHAIERVLNANAAPREAAAQALAGVKQHQPSTRP